MKTDISNDRYITTVTQNGDCGHTTVVDLFRAQARVSPNAIAIADQEEALSYSVLDERSERLAHHLRQLGISPGEIIGLCLPRSAATAVAALGILRAGAAYLPLDPSYPAERLRFILQDAGVRWIVTPKNGEQMLPAGKWELIGTDFPETGSDPVNTGVEPSSLAYVIYTSGSTGEPKGVRVTHANLSNLVSWHRRAFDVTSTDRATLLASPGFDASVWELWPYLASGATVLVPEATLHSGPSALRDWILKERVTITFLPTAIGERMFDLSWPANASLRLLLTGADTLRKRPPASLPFRCVNNYGPTECTVVATSGVIAPDGDADTLPPIGIPIDNVEVHILDEELQPVPDGSAGELCISGANVSLGYLNRPSLSAHRFVDWKGKRIYRSGDLARRLPDGQIAFLGRIDQQIKIRGFRIEPNEIIKALDQHPLVSASTVVARLTSDDQTLVAYIVPASNVGFTARGLRDHLARTLPHYMIPAMFVRVDALPLTNNGKVDRDALPEPGPDNAVQDEKYVAPSTPVEEALAKIVENLLAIDRVGVHDNFFLLGGHSLLGAQLVSQIRSQFGVQLRLGTIFENPTVAGLAEEIDRGIMEKISAMSDEEIQRMLT